MHRLSRSSRRATAVQRGGAQLFRQGQAMTIALYDMKDSPHARKVRLFAAELGIPLELIPRDPRKGETRAEDFLAKNPNGRVPTLVEGDFVLWESPAILKYLAAKHPERGLGGADAEQQALIDQMAVLVGGRRRSRHGRAELGALHQAQGAAARGQRSQHHGRC